MRNSHISAVYMIMLYDRDVLLSNWLVDTFKRSIKLPSISAIVFKPISTSRWKRRACIMGETTKWYDHLHWDSWADTENKIKNLRIDSFLYRWWPRWLKFWKLQHVKIVFLILTTSWLSICALSKNKHSQTNSKHWRITTGRKYTLGAEVSHPQWLTTACVGAPVHAEGWWWNDVWRLRALVLFPLHQPNREGVEQTSNEPFEP